MKSIRGACKKGFAFSWLVNKSIPELLLFTFTLLVPLVLITQSEVLYIINFWCVLSTILTLKDNKFFSREKHTLVFKLFSYISILIQILSHILMVLIIFFNEIQQAINSAIIFFFYILLLLYLIMLLISTLAITNLLLYIFLKFIFPFEIRTSPPTHNISLKNLSMYMTISDQISFLMVALFNVFLIVGTSMYGVEHFSRLLDRLSEEASESISLFPFMNSEWFSLGTTMGILSVVIALLSVSVPAQKKIYNLAYKKYVKNLNVS